MNKLKTAAKVARATDRFCLNPLCLHVAGTATCKKDCCKIRKS